jgi:hypothetical protein
MLASILTLPFAKKNGGSFAVQLQDHITKLLHLALSSFNTGLKPVPLEFPPVNIIPLLLEPPLFDSNL